MVYPRPTEFLCVCFLEKLVGLPFALCDLSDLPRSAFFCSQSRQPACLHLLALELDPPDPFGPCPFAAACFSSSPLGLCSKKMSLRADRFFFYLDRSGGKSSAECGSQICEQKPGRMAGAFGLQVDSPRRALPVSWSCAGGGFDCTGMVVFLFLVPAELLGACAKRIRPIQPLRLLSRAADP